MGDHVVTIDLLLAKHAHQLPSLGSAACWLPVHAACAAASPQRRRRERPNGNTPLNIACACGHDDVGATLIEGLGAW